MAYPKPANIIEIDEDRLEQLKKERAERDKIVKPVLKFKPGSIYLTHKYPGYENLPVYLHVSDFHKSMRMDSNLVRMTGQLPERPGRGQEIHNECPNCKMPFPAGYLVIHASPNQPAQDLDTTYVAEDFAKLLKDVEAKLTNG